MEGIPTTEKSGIVPKIVQDGIKSIVAVANGVVNSNRNGREHEPHPPHVNFTQLFEEATKDQSLYKGYHMTFFEEDPTCRLDVAGYTAKVYWLWQTGQVLKTVGNCLVTPLVSGKNYLKMRAELSLFKKANHLAIDCTGQPAHVRSSVLCFYTFESPIHHLLGIRQINQMK